VLQGKLVALMPYTPERCHTFWRKYVADPAMWAEEYVYDRDKVSAYYRSKTSDPRRRFFAVCHEDTVVGEIQLKKIDFGQGCATLSIHLANDAYKNRGWGSEAIRLLTDYAFQELGLETVYADCVLRNARSRHVLEKTGFEFLCEDTLLRYYRLTRKP
jgi:RimJ/RimL family protein N-acetyltransferase